jgi:hypothetical protein
MPLAYLVAGHTVILEFQDTLQHKMRSYTPLKENVPEVKQLGAVTFT